MYKIGSIIETETADYELRHPKTGVGLGVIFTLAGPSHDKRIALESARTERAQAAFRKSGTVELLSYEEQQAQRVETVIASVVGWSGVDREYSPAAARQWFSDPREAWVVRQLSEALNEQARFINDSAPA